MRVSDLVNAATSPPAPQPTSGPSFTPDPNVDPLMPPVNYDWPWWIVLPVFLLLLVAWFLLSRRLARRRRRDDVATPSAPKAPLPLPIDVRRKAWSRIDDIERRTVAGELSARDAHIELSGVLRELAFFTSSHDARKMNLDELRAAGMHDLANIVGSFYPVAFAAPEANDARAAIVTARQAVTRWS
ncbi:MAG TPA: hypothetical protein VNT53_10520 [Pseudolysinimonas sp.]|nr:hypothetical protein [Pseudolysinimonas sp.]